MKILYTSLMWAIPLLGFSQNIDKSKYNSLITELTNATGTLIEKQYVPIAKVGTLEIEILVIEDLLVNKKLKGLRFSSLGKGTYDTRQVGFIDEDEIEELLKSFEIIDEKISQGIPNKTIELNFSSRSKFEFGAFVSDAIKNPSWKYYLTLNPYSDDANIFISLSNYNLIRGHIIEAFETLKKL